MISDLFDSPWKILIVAAVLIVLFGARKLPEAARSLGQSMRILKKEVQGLHEDEPSPSAYQAPPAERHLAPAPVPDAGEQVQALQARISDLQAQAGGGGTNSPYVHQPDSLVGRPQEMD
jgi:sec-independent protein translocase protein TatA